MASIKPKDTRPKAKNNPGWYLELVQAFILVLLGTIATAQECNYQQSICECDPEQTECYFTFIIEKMSSFTSYKLTKAKSGTFIDVVNAPSTSYFFNSNGVLQPKDNVTEDPSVCSVYNEHFVDYDCSKPMTADSKLETLILTVNGLFPGPTLVVSFNQTIIVDVTNNLLGEELAVHWHGIHQNSTPWMDGAEHITQCPIPAFTTFRYIFKAVPSGTMWYHSHTGIQRLEGIFGSLVVKESDELIRKAEATLQDMIGEEFKIVDEPQHTLTILQWLMPSTFLTGVLTFNLTVPPIPSVLFNGMGRKWNFPYNSSRMSIFNVQYREEGHPIFYRFRLVGAQDYVMYRFSIAEHKLIAIATDGVLTEPIEVDYLNIDPGERYDILLKPKSKAEANGKSDFIILAEMMSVPIPFFGKGEGILHYGTDEDQPSSAEYEEIVTSTVPRNCTQDSLCFNLNCAFLEYPSEYFIRCIPVTQMQLLFETEDEVPSNDIEDKNEHFFAFSIENLGQINGRTSVPFIGSPLTHSSDLVSQNLCELGQFDCEENPDLCVCTHMIDLDSRFATIQFVIMSVRDITDGLLVKHPVHLHGHSFQVVGIFYGIYDSSGTVVDMNPNVTCNGDPRCTNPTWTSSRVDGGEVTSKTIRKDTLSVPIGGYAVIRFIADNPGYWYLHCHLQEHLLGGMNVVINELNELHNPPPKQLAMHQCGNVDVPVDEFHKLGGVRK